MNIKSRLKKLEQQIIGNNSEFCGCLKETVFKIVPFGESEETTETTYCETCGKRNSKPIEAFFTITTRNQYEH